MAERAPVDPDGLLEYSVVFTDRSLNHMSERFQAVMRDISDTLKQVYAGDAVVVVPGGGTYGMEAIARQFAGSASVLVIRNGYFSYRWSQILAAGAIPAGETVLKARPTAEGPQAPWAPPPLDEVVSAIRKQRPDVVFAPHVETSAGILLPPGYLAAIADAVHDHGGLFVLDCVASGPAWVDMRASGVDVLLTAPQKGWSATPSAALVVLSGRGVDRLEQTRSSSFAADLRRWRQIMKAYEQGGHAYHATLPTDALVNFRNAMHETLDAGREEVERRFFELGARVRALLAAHGYPSVAAPGYESPGVVVCHTDDPDVKSGKRFAEAGVQVAGGVPLMCDEPDDFSTFRIGLFGLDKWLDVEGTVARLRTALERMRAPV